MDYTKNVVGILAVMMLLMIVPTASAFVEYDTLPRSFSSGDMTSVIITINESDPMTYHIKTSDAYDSSESIYLMIAPADFSSDLTTNFTILCDFQAETYILGNSSYWGTYGYTILPFELSDLGDNTLGDSCVLTASGESIMMTTYMLPSSRVATLYTVPDTAMAELVNKTSTILGSVFDLMEMLLTVSALVIFIFVIVFIWKLIEYFASRVSKRGRIN